jgi:hypothetical protein
MTDCQDPKNWVHIGKEIQIEMFEFIPRPACVWSFDLKLRRKSKNRPSRPQVFLPNIASNADKQATHSMELSFLYKTLYSEFETALFFKRYDHSVMGTA